MSAEEIANLRDELEAIDARMADVALELLHRALSDPDPKASIPARREKIITRARRSVAKATQLLGSIDDPADD